MVAGRRGGPWEGKRDSTVEPRARDLFIRDGVSGDSSARPPLRRRRLLSVALPRLQTVAERRWQISVEVRRPELLDERGGGPPTAVDVLLEAWDVVMCVAAKCPCDAAKRFGHCSQFSAPCRGCYGPESDVKTHSPAHGGSAAPEGDHCPLNRCCQLARTLCFAAARSPGTSATPRTETVRSVRRRAEAERRRCLT